MKPVHKKYFFLLLYIGLVITYLCTNAINNVKTSQVYVIAIFSTLALSYLFSFKGKINYLFLLLLVLQASADFFYIKEGISNFSIALTLYFSVDVILGLMLRSRIKKLGNNERQVKIISSTLVVLSVLFVLFLILNLVNIVTIIFGLMMLFLVWLAYNYHANAPKDSSFWLLFGVFAYLGSSLLSSFEIFIAPNIYYVNLKVLIYVTAMYCITKAVIKDSEVVNY